MLKTYFKVRSVFRENLNFVDLEFSVQYGHFYYSQIIMKFIVKLFPEIMIKSETVRKRFAKILTSNIRNILQKYDEETAVLRHWDYRSALKNEANREELIALYNAFQGFIIFRSRRKNRLPIYIISLS